METMGALHSAADPRQSSRLIMSLSEVEYSRMRPQPVQVRLQVCKGSSCRTVTKRLVPRSLWPMMYAAILLVSARGNLIGARIVTGASVVSTKAGSGDVRHRDQDGRRDTMGRPEILQYE